MKVKSTVVQVALMSVAFLQRGNDFTRDSKSSFVDDDYTKSGKVPDYTILYIVYYTTYLVMLHNCNTILFSDYTI